MKIEIDTKEDSVEEIRKAIRLLQNLIGDSQDTQLQQQSTASSFNNIFGDASASEPTAKTSQEAQSKETSESTEDLFAELFSEEELKKMDTSSIKEEDIKPKDKKYNIELY